MRGCDGTPAVAELTTPSTRAWSPRTSPAGLTFRSPNAGEGDGETIVEGSEVAVARGVGDSVVAGGVQVSTRAAAIRRRRIASVWRSRPAGRQQQHRRETTDADQKGVVWTSVLFRPSVVRRKRSPFRSTAALVPRTRTEIGRPPGLSLNSIEMKLPMSTP